MMATFSWEGMAYPRRFFGFNRLNGSASIAARPADGTGFRAASPRFRHALRPEASGSGAIMGGVRSAVDETLRCNEKAARRPHLNATARRPKSCPPQADLCAFYREF
jgi:hypothetical protein